MNHRHARQSILPEVGEAGQERLSRSVVAIVGMGALGSVAAELLCRAGVGRLILLDYDLVELSNLQRQTLYEEADVGKPKVAAAKAHLSRIDHDIRIDAFTKQLNLTTLALLDDADVILDCTDNLQTRFLLNEHAMQTKRPFVYCGAVETRGMVYVVDPSRQERACFHCIFDALKAVENCEDYGVLNVTTHLAASLQAAEALKLLLGAPYTEGLISFNAWEFRFDTFATRKKPGCAVCSGVYDRLAGKGPAIEFCVTKRCVKARPNAEMGIDLAKVKAAFDVIDDYGANGLKVKADDVEVLVYPHGGMELATRDQDAAERIAKRIREKG